MRANVIRQRLAEGRPIINGWLSMASSYGAEGAGHCGFHSVTVDMQHGMIGFSEAISMLQAISATPAMPLARVGQLNGASIMQLLDAGSYGIICPMVSTAEQAQALVSACRYPPHGERSFGPARGMLYGGADYVAKANDTVMAIPMIETSEAVDNIDDILAVPGIDMLYVGPNDLAFSLNGKQGDDGGRTELAIAKIVSKALAANMPLGIFCANANEAEKRLAQGFSLVTPGNDFGTLMRTNKANVSQLLGDEAPAIKQASMGGYG
ncbi:MAG: aldolase/citrate lyase family protein [Ahrensia sp.]